MLRFVTLVPAALLIAATPALRADSITYDVTLSPTYGSQAGSGTITVASAPANSGTTTYTVANGQLQNLAFTFGDETFFLSADPDASVQFTDGQVSRINFLQTVDHAPARYTLELANGFQFYGNDFDHPLSAGTLAATPAIALPDSTTNFTAESTQPASPTPEPGTLLLVLTALIAGAFLVFRRHRAAQS